LYCSRRIKCFGTCDGKKRLKNDGFDTLQGWGPVSTQSLPGLPMW
jgi:hypothetical protein